MLARQAEGLFLLQLVSSEATPFVVGQGVCVVAAGRVEPYSRHLWSNSPGQANTDGQEVTADALADVVGQHTEGVHLDLPSRWHIQGEQPCWGTVDEGQPVPQVWPLQVRLPSLVIPRLTGPLVLTANAKGRAADQG